MSRLVITPLHLVSAQAITSAHTAINVHGGGLADGQSVWQLSWLPNAGAPATYQIVNYARANNNCYKYLSAGGCPGGGLDLWAQVGPAP